MGRFGFVFDHVEHRHAQPGADISRNLAGVGFLVCVVPTGRKRRWVLETVFKLGGVLQPGILGAGTERNRNPRSGL